MRLFGLVVVVWLGLGASVVHAAEVPEPCAPEVTLRRAQIEYRGKAGVWFDIEVARCLLTRVAQATEQQALLGDYQARGLLQIDLMDLTTAQKDLAIQERDAALVGMDRAIKLQGAAERKLASPGRSRALWFAVGMVTSAALIGVSAYAVTATR